MATESQQQAFEQFERKTVRLPDSENREAKEVHPEIRGALEEHLEEVIETFLSGSYSRKVQVVKLNDVDIIVVLTDPEGTFAASPSLRVWPISSRSERGMPPSRWPISAPVPAPTSAVANIAGGKTRPSRKSRALDQGLCSL